MEGMLTKDPPEQPTISEVIEEPIAGPETIVEETPVTDTVVDPGDAQPSLIPMTDDELREAGGTLARLVRDYALMEAEHAAERADRSEERKKLKERITALAQTIRQQGR